MDTSLDIIERFPENKYNLLIPIKTVAQIAEIQRPVMNTVYISTNLEDKEIYVQEKAKPASNGYSEKPALYALTKRGLTKLMRAAGIKQLESKPVVPSTCQKCAEINRGIGKTVCCGNCANQDVKYECKILVPQLTGENLTIVANKEIAVKEAVIGMTPKQETEFLKFRSEMCESKALNRALRTAMQIKGTYLIEELKKPFVVAYLVPNLDNPLVKQKAVDNMFGSAQNLFGEQSAREIVIADEGTGEVIEGVCCEVEPPIEPPRVQPMEPPPCKVWTCGVCGKEITAKAANYSIDKMGRPLCFEHQKEERR